MNERDQLAVYKGLLTRAVDFVQQEVTVMRDSYTDSNGNFDIEDEDAHLEVANAERWLKEAREALDQREGTES